MKKNQITLLKTIKIKSNLCEKKIINTLVKGKNKFDLIIAIDGGSGIDAGKLIKHYFNNFAKLFAIYTLPGSATILSSFAIFNNNEFKVGLLADNFIPDCSYINSNIMGLINYKQKVIAVTDIFSCAIEFLYSKVSNNYIKKESKKALKLLIKESIKNLSIYDFIMADIRAGLTESKGLVLFPHAPGHYLTYKFNISHSIATIHFLLSYFIFLRKKGIDIDLKYLEYIKYLKLLLIKKKLLKNIKLSEKNIVELFHLTKKYMNFVYDNAPVYIKQEEYKEIIQKYIGQ